MILAAGTVGGLRRELGDRRREAVLRDEQKDESPGKMIVGKMIGQDRVRVGIILTRIILTLVFRRLGGRRESESR